MSDIIEVKKKMLNGYNCAQTTFSDFADRFDYSEEEFLKMAAGLGGGMFHGDNCGAVGGAVLALSMEYGDDIPLLKEKIALFFKRFSERFGSVYCRDLVGFDFALPGQEDAAEASGAFEEKCPYFVHGAIEIVNDIFEGK